jgi:membrane protease YdiL (CAAX protease family)
VGQGRPARARDSAASRTPSPIREPITAWEAAGGHRAIIETVIATAIAAGLIRLAEWRGGPWAMLIPATWIYIPLLLALARRSIRVAPDDGCGPFGAFGEPPAWREGARWLFRGAVAVLIPFAIVAAGVRMACGRPPAGPLGSADAGSMVLGLFLVAVPEELFFRGYVQSRLRAWSRSRDLRGPWAAIALTSLLFALAHVLVAPGWIRAAVFFPGLVLGWLRERSGGLLAPIGFHWLANVAWMTFVAC